MQSNKKVWVALVVVAIIAISGVSVTLGYPHSQTADRSLGSVPTLDGVDSPFMTINGVRTYNYSQPIAATSSVACSIKNPFNATSTLVRYGVNVTTNGIGVAQTLEVSTSTTNNSPTSTSSPAFVKAFPASAGQFSFVWNGNSATTSALTIGSQPYSTGISNDILGPSDYINFVISTSTPGTFSPYYKGNCTGVIQKL